MNKPIPRIWIITGVREAGKTRFCINLIKRAREQGMSVEGLVCPPGFEGNEKTSIQIKDLKSGKRAALASLRKQETQGLFTDRWNFDEKVLNWGDQILGSIQSSDVLVIDELGPLEFFRGKGWQNGLRQVDEGNYHIALVVIRPELLDMAKKRWPQARLIEVQRNMDEKEESRLHKLILGTDDIYISKQFH